MPLTFNEAVACDESQITRQPGLNNGILATGTYLDSDLPSLEQVMDLCWVTAVS